MARTLQIFRFWDIQTTSEAARISIADDQGQEYWMKVLKPGTGRGWREARHQAIEQIQDAMDAGEPPGEVVVDRKADAVAS